MQRVALLAQTEKELVIMDAAEIAEQHAQYHAAHLPQFLAHKSPERVAEVIAWTGEYCRNRLPAILIDRQSVKRDDDQEGYDQ